MTRISFNTLLLLVLAIVAFAGNSVLTRLALAQNLIGAADFTFVRLFAGAVMLLVLCRGTLSQTLPTWRDTTGILSLFTYAIAFTLAYVEVNAATGALVLFATVQLTMITISHFRGTHISMLECIGMALAFTGLAWLLLPNATAPPVHAAALMVLAGIAWGFYSLDGRNAVSPLLKTTRNFVGAAVLGFLPLLLFANTDWNWRGAALAVASGAITSALGYAVWYRVLPQISVALAGASQLAVPMVAAAGGAVLIGEALTQRLFISSIVVLAGIAVAVFGRKSS